ncbi:MAG: Rrf2 family transcriptional regulator [Sneathiella sp.]
MRKDQRLSRILHILVHMEAHKEPVTSRQISEMLTTNPVVVRQLMGRLRECGYVRTTQGRSGGWTLHRALKDITFLEIYQIFGETSLFTIGLTDEHSDCLIEKSINAELETAMDEAGALLLARFNVLTLDRLKRGFPA